MPKRPEGGEMHVLVIVASPQRGTHFVAEALGDQFTSRGVAADVMWPAEIGSLDPYDAVIVGAALRRGHWRRDARLFVKGNAGALTDRPVWLFSTHKAGRATTGGDGDVDLGSIVRNIGVHEHRVFGVPSNRSLRRAARGKGPAVRIRWDELSDWAAGIIDQLSINRMWMSGQVVSRGYEVEEPSSR